MQSLKVLWSEWEDHGLKCLMDKGHYLLLLWSLNTRDFLVNPCPKLALSQHAIDIVASSSPHSAILYLAKSTVLQQLFFLYNYLNLNFLQRVWFIRKYWISKWKPLIQFHSHAFFKHSYPLTEKGQGWISCCYRPIKLLTSISHAYCTASAHHGCDKPQLLHTHVGYTCWRIHDKGLLSKQACQWVIESTWNCSSDLQYVEMCMPTLHLSALP